MKKVNIRRATILWSWIIMLLVITVPVLADGGMFFTKVLGQSHGNPPDSPNQRALIMHDGKTERLIVQVKYQGRPMDFSWVIPLPSVPSPGSIKAANDEIFNTLYSLTQPSIYVVEAAENGRGYGDSKDGPQAENLTPPLQVWEQLNVGPYFITTFSASRKDTLINWLNRNGYAFPESAGETIQHYIDRKWCFIAVKVDFQGKDSSFTSQSLVPLEIEFASPEIVFPLRISEVSAAPLSEIVLYVLTKHRTVCNYPTKEIDAAKLFNEIDADLQKSNKSGIDCSCKNPSSPGSYDYDYEAFFQRELEACNEPTFLVEYASYFYSWSVSELEPYLSRDSSYFLTRFRTYLTPDQMNDVVLKPDPDGDNILRLQMYYYYAAYAPDRVRFFAFGIAGLFLLPISLVSRLRKKYARKGWLLLLILLIAI